MKRKLKALLCTALAVLIMFASTVTALAQEDVTPVIMVHGMGAFSLYKNPGTPEETEAFSFDIGTALSQNLGMIVQLLHAAGGNDADVDDIMDALSDIADGFKDIACDKNGNSAPDVGISSFWTDSLANHSGYLGYGANEPAVCNQICKKIGAENVYSFNYDWRLDACENADKLSDYIDMVKRQTGKNKVTLIGGSEGTIVVSAYLDAYGESKNEIKRVVLLNGAMQGVAVTKAFKQDLVFEKDIILDYVSALADVYQSGDIDMSTIKTLALLLNGGVDNLCKFLTEIVNDKAMLNRLYNDIFYPVIGCIPALWEFIPYDDFDECVDKMSSIGFLDKTSGLYKKISHYHGVQGRLQSNIIRLQKSGVEFAVIANYGTPAIPVTSAHDWQGDVLIDTRYASIGATLADYGKTLNKKGEYISEDKIVDASTCLLPNQTWFIKGVQHMNFWAGTEATDFVAEIVTTNAPLNVKSIKKETGIGQFIGTDFEQNIISVTETAVPKPRPQAAGQTATPENDLPQSKSPMTGNEPTAFIAAGMAVLSSLLIAFSARSKRHYK